MKNIEIERKWLFKESDYIFCKPKEMISLEIGYTKDDIRVSKFNVFNVKKNEEKIYFKINTKSIIDGSLVRQENKCHITENVFNSIYEKTLGKRIIKRRNIYEIDGHKIEIDFFEYCKFIPLTIIEIEFNSKEEAIKYKPILPFFGKEITNNFKYLNINLAY